MEFSIEFSENFVEIELEKRYKIFSIRKEETLILNFQEFKNIDLKNTDLKKDIFYIIRVFKKEITPTIFPNIKLEKPINEYFKVIENYHIFPPSSKLILKFEKEGDYLIEIYRNSDYLNNLLLVINLKVL